MARDFNGTSQYLSRTSAVVTAFPCTMACWTILDNASGNQETLISFGNSASNDALFRLAKDASDNVFVQTRDDGSANSNSNSGAAITTGSWQHLGGIFDSNGVGTSWYNGASTAPTQTNVLGAITLDRTSVGGLLRASAALYWDGKIAEAAIWDIELTAAEMLSLAAGISPAMVRPNSLVSYWPIIGRNDPETDLFGANDLTVTNAPVVSAHPRVIYPAPFSVITVPVAVAAAGQPTMRRWGGVPGMTPGPQQPGRSW